MEVIKTKSTMEATQVEIKYTAREFRNNRFVSEVTDIETRLGAVEACKHKRLSDASVTIDRSKYSVVIKYDSSTRHGIAGRSYFY